MYQCFSYTLARWHQSGKSSQLISTSDDQSVILDIPSWTSRAALDTIGEAAFDYPFGALDDSPDITGTKTSGEKMLTSSILNNGSWLRGRMNKEVPFGVYGNLFSFVGGLRQAIRPK
ncbi:hypothetical protein ARMSODRAFT_952389 [Armillaria solidipes]|uniref:Uncharacterized protein n=1 Tax=Armillaria solidipes TaxID=1076256 RepID=A0A2H3BR47_9AGAR|nr:hypothetical protein ARMSODRAFT_952389 [Armillaria solidipes]